MATPAMPDDELLARWQLVVQGVARTQHRVSEQIDEAGVPAQWFAALHLLLQAPDRRLPMSRLARDLTMTSGGFTKLADRMAREGLIDRRGSSDDRRVVYATLTDEGVQIAQRLRGEFVAALREQVTEVISDRGLESISEIARALSEAHAAAGTDDDESTADVGRDPNLPERRARTRPS